jgi:site-specific DNA recombinase
MTQAVGYIRVSTADQADNGVSLEAQRARIEAWAVANGYELTAVHVDAGLSGKRADNRPALQDALTEVTACRGILVCYSLSRLSRSVSDTLQISERLQAAGADLCSLTEKLDTSSAGGRMLFTMLSAFAQFERDLTSERTTAALQHKRQQGERVGEIPFGYALADDGVQLVPVAHQQRAIALIRELRAAGCTLQRICDELERAGILTAKGCKRWTPKTVSRIVSRSAA